MLLKYSRPFVLSNHNCTKIIMVYIPHLYLYLYLYPLEDSPRPSAENFLPQYREENRFGAVHGRSTGGFSAPERRKNSLMDLPQRGAEDPLVDPVDTWAQSIGVERVSCSLRQNYIQGRSQTLKNG